MKEQESKGRTPPIRIEDHSAGLMRATHRATMQIRSVHLTVCALNINIIQQGPVSRDLLNAASFGSSMLKDRTYLLEQAHTHNDVSVVS